MYPSWASSQILKPAGCVCAGNAGNVFPATDFKGNRQLATPACITAHASRTCRDACRDRGSVAGKTFPAFPAHAQPAILRIWKEAHGMITNADTFVVLLSTSVDKREKIQNATWRTKQKNTSHNKKYWEVSLECTVPGRKGISLGCRFELSISSYDR